jgi:hypothetical protein
MGLPRTFVGFSSDDLHYYRLMTAWKANKKIDFNFTDCQLRNEINSENEAYIKRLCRQRINLAGRFVQLIGENTKYKHKYVRWEAEVAIEKGCTILGVNLNGSREIDANCPTWLRDIGVVFVPFSPSIIKYALENYKMNNKGNWRYKPEIYKSM